MATVQTKTDLSKWEALYDTFDQGHNRRHMERVRSFTIGLAQKYCPEKTELAYIAATLHDVGISLGRDEHEVNGANMTATDQDLKQNYSEEEVGEIIEAVREHRSTTGNPKGIVAKIVSDADRASDSTKTFMKRTYKYGLKHYPELDHRGQIVRAAKLLKDRFGPEGAGTRLYFQESIDHIKKAVEPIVVALDRENWTYLESLLE